MKSSLIISHFVAAVITSAVILLVYASVQQSFRASANDPQIQIARDISNAMSTGRPLSNLLPHDTIDLAKSLALFVETFDNNGNPLLSTALINGSMPKPPAGIFQFTRENGEDILTWQPENDIRMAMVFEKIKGDEGFIAAGRSLKETEVRESNLVRMVLITWFACMCLLMIHLLVQNYLVRKSKQLQHEN